MEIRKQIESFLPLYGIDLKTTEHIVVGRDRFEDELLLDEAENVFGPLPDIRTLVGSPDHAVIVRYGGELLSITVISGDKVVSAGRMDPIVGQLDGTSCKTD